MDVVFERFQSTQMLDIANVLTATSLGALTVYRVNKPADGQHYKMMVNGYDMFAPKSPLRYKLFFRGVCPFMIGYMAPYGLIGGAVGAACAIASPIISALNLRAKDN